MHFFRVFMVAMTLVSFASVQGAQATKCQLYFSPEDHLADKLIALIDQESKTIYIAVYCFTHKGIVQALIRAKERGVKVEVIVDPFTLKPGVAISQLHKAHIPVFVWNPPASKKKRQPLMHDKFCVFGTRAVWTGSFNFTNDANLAHQENAVVIESQELAGRFQHQFHTLKHRGCKPYAEMVESK
jgi:phosphatidylserine/phosphatidylglycerophosphate/cardiolipin synthase-like enzyme